MRDWWNPTYTIVKTLLRFSSQLLQPDLNDMNCCSEEVALLIKEDPEKFKIKAKEWTRLYAMEDTSSDTDVQKNQENFDAYDVEYCPNAR